jgi:RNA polymerase sigma factor (sigma-70 family)
MAGQPSIIFVIDEDRSMRDVLENLIRSVSLKIEVEHVGSPREFLRKNLPPVPSCLVLDVKSGRESGLDFQRELAAAKISIPVIFVTGEGDIAMSVRAMKAGAVDFLTKPLRDQDLLDAIQTALEKDRIRRRQDAEMAVLRERYESLTSREREVLGMVVAGMLNRKIAAKIGTTENTVKVHRSRAMEKMQAQSLADLVKMIDKLHSTPAGSA